MIKIPYSHVALVQRARNEQNSRSPQFTRSAHCLPPQAAADPWRGVRSGGRSDRYRGRVLLSLLLLPALQEATAHQWR